MTVEIFVSYVREDKRTVDELFRELKMAQLDPWMDYPPSPYQHSGLTPGVDWDQAIRGKIDTAELVFVCFSKKSVDKEGYYQREIRLALDRMSQMPPDRTLIVPILLEECRPREVRVDTVSLGSKNWYHYYRDGVDGLVRLANRINQDSPEPTDGDVIGVDANASVSSPLQTEQEAFILLRRIKTLDKSFVAYTNEYSDVCKRLDSELEQRVGAIQRLARSTASPFEVRSEAHSLRNGSFPILNRQTQNDSRARVAITQILAATEDAYRAFFAAYSDWAWVDEGVLELQRPRLQKMRDTLNQLSDTNSGLLSVVAGWKRSTEGPKTKEFNKARRLRIQELKKFNAAVTTWLSAIDRSEGFLEEALELVR